MISSFSAVSLLAVTSIVSAQGSYTPSSVTCPSDLIRSATNISSGERTYLANRAPQVQQALRTFISSANISGLDIDSLFSSNTTIPRVAYAASGGGLRAMVYGGSIINALDSRSNSKSNSVGGILQGMQYIAGLSGGSWLIGSIAINDFATIPSLVANNWDIDNVFEAPSGGILSSVSYYTDIVEQVQDKNGAGFFTSITDYWGRIISYHVLNSSTGYPGLQWSDIRNQTAFMNYSMPFPVVIADARAPGMLIVDSNATIYEFNPYEFGSWDENIYSFTQTEYLGSNLTNGKPTDGNTCVTGFDNVGFTVGTSSSLFNAAITELNGSDSGILTRVISAVLGEISKRDDDIAFYPNPFYGLEGISQNISNSGNLTLTDGGMDNQNIPFWPLIQPERQVDTIFAVDSSADTNYNWPNGSSLVHTYRRVTELQQRTNKSISFPYVPDFNTFINKGLNKRVTFFGCDGNNGTLAGTPPPLVIYIPNAPYSYMSNFSTYDGEYSHQDIVGTLNNGFNVMTNGNATNMTTCLACAMIQRGIERGNISQPAACAQCFTDLCWDGTTNSTQPGMALLAPSLMDSATGANATGSSSSSKTSGASTFLYQNVWSLFTGASLLALSML